MDLLLQWKLPQLRGQTRLVSRYPLWRLAIDYARMNRFKVAKENEKLVSYELSTLSDREYSLPSENALLQ